MAALEPADQAAFDAAGGAGEDAEHPCMGAFVAGEGGAFRFRSVVVHPLPGCSWAVMVGRTVFAPKRRAIQARTRERQLGRRGPDLQTSGGELLLPQFGVAILGLGEADIEVGDLGAAFGRGHRAVEIRGVHLVLAEATVAGDIGGGALFGHCHPQTRCCRGRRRRRRTAGVFAS